MGASSQMSFTRGTLRVTWALCLLQTHCQIAFSLDLITIAVIRTFAMSGRDLDWEEDACAKGSLMLLQATCTKRSVSWPFFVPHSLGVASFTSCQCFSKAPFEDFTRK